MRKAVKPGRIVVLILLPLLLSAVAVAGLYNLQIVNGHAYYEESMNSIVTTETVAASRGSILDRNGRVLVSNRISYNIGIDRERLVASGDPNGVLLELAGCAVKFGESYTDTLPVSASAPFSYLSAMTDDQANILSQYFEHFALDENISAPDFIAWLRSHYSVPDSYSDADARTVIGIRYELETHTLFIVTPYVFVTDSGIDLISFAKEHDFAGVSIDTSTVREYHTKYAAHILGRVGPMDSDEYEYYKTLDYPMNALIGKDGIEQVYENYLHGTDGVTAVTRTSDGTITASSCKEEPQAGSDVVLTLDIRCQQAAEDSLARTISSINADRDEDTRVKGGAVVVMQVGTGDVLASASYPTYDLSTFSQDYASLLTAPDSPLYNRALKGTYSPGSTFKMNTAIAALQAGVITPTTLIYDKGIYDKYKGYVYKCWAYPHSHGWLNVSTAIQNSCNYFFYTVGVDTGIDTISHYAALFGLGQPTGIELDENTGVLASRKYKEDTVGEDWYPGDTITASIGQSYNLFTPMQLASYVATIADNGDRYAAHLLKSVKTYDGSKTTYSYEPSVLSRVDAKQEYFDAVKLGMYDVSKYGSSSAIFGDYPVDVASKTGTAQLGDDKVNNGVFVAFAPYEDPEIAVAVVVEGGGSGSAVAQIAKDIFDYWFAAKNSDTVISTEDSLVK